MSVHLGAFADDGSPTLAVTVLGRNKSADLDAIIDTGFTGFLLIGKEAAAPLGFVPNIELQTMRLADGSMHRRQTALGAVRLGEETKRGLIVLEPNNEETLLGMTFLREFGGTLVVSADSVGILADSSSQPILDLLRSGGL